MSKLSAGLLAAIPLAIVFAIHVLIRGRALATFFQSSSPEIARVSPLALFFIMLGCMVAMAFAFGAVAGLVYGKLGMPNFRTLAFGAALVFSVLALISKTPLVGDKITWNLAVGGLLGWLIPVFAG